MVCILSVVRLSFIIALVTVSVYYVIYWSTWYNHLITRIIMFFYSKKYTGSGKKMFVKKSVLPCNFKIIKNVLRQLFSITNSSYYEFPNNKTHIFSYLQKKYVGINYYTSELLINWPVFSRLGKLWRKSI